MVKTNNFTSDLIFMDSECCGKIYMLEKAQLFFHCELCGDANLYAEYEELFQHYVDAHKYAQQCFESDDNSSEIQDDNEQPTSPKVNDSTDPGPTDRVGLNMSPNEEEFEEESNGDYVIEVEIVEESSSSENGSEIEIKEGPKVSNSPLQKKLELQMEEQKDGTEEQCSEDKKCEQQQPRKSLRKRSERKIKVESEPEIDDTEMKSGENTKKKAHAPRGRNSTNNSAYYTLNDSGTYTCNVCNRQYETKLKMRLHAAYHKRMENNPNFPCEICGRSFKNKDNLTQHVKRHKGEKKVQCPECPRKFYMPKELRAHMVFHRGIKAFKCTTCDKAYFVKETLKDHMRRHTNERKYQCDQCDKRFFNCKQLREHEKTHSDVRAYKCDLCEMAYKTAGALWVHKQVHANLREHICNVNTTECGARFNLRRQLMVHLKQVHKMDKDTIAQTLNL